MWKTGQWYVRQEQKAKWGRNREEAQLLSVQLPLSHGQQDSQHHFPDSLHWHFGPLPLLPTTTISWLFSQPPSPPTSRTSWTHIPLHHCPRGWKPFPEASYKKQQACHCRWACEDNPSIGWWSLLPVPGRVLTAYSLSDAIAAAIDPSLTTIARQITPVNNWTDYTTSWSVILTPACAAIAAAVLCAITTA